MNKPLPKIGVDMFHYAELLTDTLEGVEYGDIKALENIVRIAVNTDSKIESFYADNKKAATATTIGDLIADIDLADIPAAVLAEWLGQAIENGVLDVGDANPKYFGFAYRIKKADNSYRYVRCYKAMFTLPNEEVTTKNNSASFQGASCQASMSQRAKDGLFYSRLDSNDVPNMTTAELDAAWFGDFNYRPIGSVSTAVATTSAKAKTSSTEN